MSTTESLVLADREVPLAILTLNNSARRNALSRAVLEELRDRLNGLASDRAVRVVILRATGPVFSSGHDLNELVGATADEAASLFRLCTEVMEAIRQLPQPVIAEVQGMATAAGCQLVASCDLVVAAEVAQFATPGVKIGLFCTTPAVALCRVVPSRKALEMLLTGAPISAVEAERLGLVNRVVPGDRLAEETRRLARQIAAASGYTLMLGKRAFYQQLPLDRPAAYALAQAVMVENSQAPDAQEGMKAFLEKRPPCWQS
ncbi:MAG: enoyl-CoA hydratase [Gemmataceae bacterium]|nr:enoyl-CoA hydratase [Gemmataceae bacterium]MDW8266292.1 enoyl-CoA hydratase [Gemmataceae bacterium]